MAGNVHSRLRYEQLFFIIKRYKGKWLSDYVETIDFDSSQLMLIGSGPVCSSVCSFFPETRPDTKGGKGRRSILRWSYKHGQ